MTLHDVSTLPHSGRRREVRGGDTVARISRESHQCPSLTFPAPSLARGAQGPRRGTFVASGKVATSERDRNCSSQAAGRSRSLVSPLGGVHAPAPAPGPRGGCGGRTPAPQQLAQAFHPAAPTCERTLNRDCRKAWLGVGEGALKFKAKALICSAPWQLISPPSSQQRGSPCAPALQPGRGIC